MFCGYIIRSAFHTLWEDKDMKQKLAVLLLVSLFVAAVSFAADANMGTWKLNEAKSKIAAGQGKNTKVVYAAAGDNIKVTVDGVGADGKPSHNEWTGKFDGKDYAVKGDPTADTRAYTRKDDHTLEMTIKKGGKVSMTGTITVSADGKSRTVSVSGTDAAGKKISSSLVYDKQ